MGKKNANGEGSITRRKDGKQKTVYIGATDEPETKLAQTRGARMD